MKNKYSLSEKIKNIISFTYTIIFNPKARLIRCPIYIRGKKYIDFGKGLTTGYRCRFEAFSLIADNEKKIIFGQNCRIGDNVHIASGKKVVIGDNVLMASKVFISDLSHGRYKGFGTHSNPSEIPNERELIQADVVIKDNVWLGENVCVLQGVTIGFGAIIGANSVVTKDIPPQKIAVGNPARVIKEYNEKSWDKII